MLTAREARWRDQAAPEASTNDAAVLAGRVRKASIDSSLNQSAHIMMIVTEEPQHRVGIAGDDELVRRAQNAVLKLRLLQYVFQKGGDLENLIAVELAGKLGIAVGRAGKLDEPLGPHSFKGMRIGKRTELI